LLDQEEAFLFFSDEAMKNKFELMSSDTNLIVFRNAISSFLISEFNEVIDRLRIDLGTKKLRNEDLTQIFSKLRTDRDYNRIETFCRRVSRQRFSEAFLRPPSEETVSYFRCANALSDSDSHKRHFDSYLMTILIPIKLADTEENNGDLIIYKSDKHAAGTIKNMLRKTFTKVDQLMPAVYRKKKTIRQLDKKECIRVPCELGNIYFFNGYSMKHCNLSVSDGERRSLLIHAYDPETSFGMSSFFRRTRFK